MALRDSFHVTVEGYENCTVDFGNRANQVIGRTPRKGPVEERNMMPCLQECMSYGIGNAFIEKESQDWPISDHATCRRAASTSASVRLGYSFRMSAVEYPASINLRIVATLMRVPEITGA
jgi:hypothetical protein